MRIKHINLIAVYFATAVSALSFPVHAEGENVWMRKDRISLSVGVYFPKIDSQIRVSNDQGQGTLIDLEDDFG